MTAMAVRRDRRTERHERTKAEIVQAAWTLADERGLAGWSLRDVAEAVGMRAPSLYVYVESKNDLYDALFADGYRALVERLAAIDRSADPAETLRRGTREFVAFCVERPPRHTLLFLRTLPGFEPSAESYALAQQVLAGTVDVLAAAGIRGSGSVDLYTAMVSGLVTQQLSNDPGGDRWTRLVDDALDLLLAGRRSRRRR
ncbi:MAG TPA: TetR/AcrR family transcriptional regulator [Mycobacteriales bacterium]|nr:TetR/AcrR family transcriptional regulator [Mycobacteriales bacterium]